MTQVLYWSTYPNGHTLGPPCTNCTDGYTPPGCGSPRGGSPPTYMSWSSSPNVSNSTSLHRCAARIPCDRSRVHTHCALWICSHAGWRRCSCTNGAAPAVIQRCGLLDRDSALFTRVFGNTVPAPRVTQCIPKLCLRGCTGSLVDAGRRARRALGHQPRRSDPRQRVVRGCRSTVWNACLSRHGCQLEELVVVSVSRHSPVVQPPSKDLH